MTRHEWCARLSSAMLQSLPDETAHVLRLRDLDDDASDLAHPFYWGGFKLSGLVNEPIAILGNHATA